MKNTKTALLVAGAAIGGAVIGNIVPSHAQNIGDILKGGVVLVAVDKLSRPINDGINKITGSGTDNIRETTKVVPVLTVGGGTYAGAVQVSGPRNLVDQVKAVAQLETQIGVAGSKVRLQAMIPVSQRGNLTDIKSISRVKGVGVSALVDLKL